MSEPTLYRIDKSQLDGVFYEGGHWAIMADEAIETLIDRCVLVPVEMDEMPAGIGGDDDT